MPVESKYWPDRTRKALDVATKNEPFVLATEDGYAVIRRRVSGATDYVRFRSSNGARRSLKQTAPDFPCKLVSETPFDRPPYAPSACKVENAFTGKYRFAVATSDGKVVIHHRRSGSKHLVFEKRSWAEKALKRASALLSDVQLVERDQLLNDAHAT